LVISTTKVEGERLKWKKRASMTIGTNVQKVLQGVGLKKQLGKSTG